MIQTLIFFPILFLIVFWTPFDTSASIGYTIQIRHADKMTQFEFNTSNSQMIKHSHDPLSSSNEAGPSQVSLSKENLKFVKEKILSIISSAQIQKASKNCPRAYILLKAENQESSYCLSAVSKEAQQAQELARFISLF